MNIAHGLIRVIGSLSVTPSFSFLGAVRKNFGPSYFVRALPAYYLPVLLASSGSQWSKSRNKEMKTREGDHVDSQLPQISIKLTRKTQTSGHTCKSNKAM